MNFTDQYIKMCDCDEVKAHDVSPNALTERWHFKQDWSVVAYPLQHETQSWIHQYGHCPYRLLMDFSHWCEEYGDTTKGRSLEEMWLMYYMWREHHKIWDGDKWINERL